MRTITANLKEKQQPIHTVGDLVQNRRCMTFHPEEFVSVILPVLQSTGGGAAGVLDDGNNLIGLLTERQILRHIFLKAVDPTINPAKLRNYIEDMRVEEAMIKYPETLDENISMEDAVGMMLRRGYRYMPVVRRVDCRHLLGIVSEHEIALHLKNRLQEAQRNAEEAKSLLSSLLHEPYGIGMHIPN